MSSLILRDAQVLGRRVDVRVEDGLVSEVAPGIPCAGGALSIDCRGGALLPGLCDHHVHLASMAAEEASVRVGPPAVRDREEMAAALRDAAASSKRTGWVRAVGYHELVAGELDRYALDAMVSEVKVRVQHRAGSMWVLNSAAVRATGLERSVLPGIEVDDHGRPNGRVIRADEWLRGKVAPPDLDFAKVGSLLARYGVTGVTDATPSEDSADMELLASALRRGEIRQRVLATGGVGLAETPPPFPLEQGPVKLVVEDHALVDPDALGADMSRAHSASRAVAVHCVSHVAVVIALAAWKEAGALAGDRIEHGSLILGDVEEEIARSGLTVVTQPSFVYERGDEYLTDVETTDRPYLYRCATLRALGIGVAASTDAPFGGADPWAAMRSARDRLTKSGAPLGREEALGARDALEMFLGPLEDPARSKRLVERGARADLCLLHVPIDQALSELDAANVRMTLVSGEPIFGE